MARETLRDRILARVATALGLEPTVVPRGTPELAPLLLPAMMERFDLDRTALASNNPDLAHMLEERCRACAVKGLCFESLARGVTADAAAGFCPNASIFTVLRPRKAS
ncbi:MAG: hypothetical protein WCZ23_10195 [Rhodospirillaceae bacterium]